MKKLSFLLTTLLSLTLLIGCSKEPNVGNYYINANGELIVVYDNGSEKILGDWGDEIINSLNEISSSPFINTSKSDVLSKPPFTLEPYK